MILYHFTDPQYVDSIREHGIVPIGEKIRRGDLPVICSDGVIRLSSGIADTLPPTIFPAENDIVWLTKAFEPTTTGLWKTGARVHVEVGGGWAIRWARAVDKYGVPPTWVKIINGTGGDPKNWYVVEGIIPPERIVAIDLLGDPTVTLVREPS